MKRFCMIAIPVLLLIVLSACGDSEASGNNTEGTVGEIQDSGVLRVGFEGTYRPFNYLDDNDEYTGFDVDIANELAGRLGVEAEFVATSWDSLIGGLKSDKFDIIIAQMTVTEERMESVDFTDPYVVTGSVLITHEDTDDIAEL